MFTFRLYGRQPGDVLRPGARSAPDVGCSKPPIIRRVVVLPQPDGPRRQKNSPSRTSRLMWSTAAASPNCLTTSTSRTSTSGTGLRLLRSPPQRRHDGPQAPAGRGGRRIGPHGTRCQERPPRASFVRYRVPFVRIRVARRADSRVRPAQVRDRRVERGRRRARRAGPERDGGGRCDGPGVRYRQQIHQKPRRRAEDACPDDPADREPPSSTRSATSRSPSSGATS